MSSTLRDATERTVHTLTDLVSDAMEHIELPHIDLTRAARRRRRLSPAFVVAIVAAIVVVAVVATRVMKRGASVGVEVDPVAEPSKAAMAAPAAA